MVFFPNLKIAQSYLMAFQNTISLNQKDCCKLHLHSDLEKYILHEIKAITILFYITIVVMYRLAKQ